MRAKPVNIYALRNVRAGLYIAGYFTPRRERTASCHVSWINNFVRGGKGVVA